MAYNSQQSQHGYGTLGSEAQSSYSHGPPPPPSYGIPPKNMADHDTPPPGYYIPEEQQYINAGDQSPVFANFEFSEKSIRRAFIRKVYSILMVQLIVTLGFILLFYLYEPLKLWTQRNTWFVFVVMAITFVLLIALACFETVRRHPPMNFIFLGIFTVAEGFLLGAITTTYRVDSVMIAVGVTAAVCLGLTIFSFQTKWDFTAFGGILFVALIVLILFGILAIFFPILKVVYACVGALLFSVYLVYDTQMMMGGKHKYSLSPEEYIFAALSLYLDIVNIFTYMLSIVGSMNE